MAVELTLPRLAQGMEVGTIVRWLKAEGDRVERGEPLYELETEKATQEVESDAAGVLLAILAAEGEELAVGSPVCLVGEPGEERPSVPGGADGGRQRAELAAEAAPAPGPALAPAAGEPAPAPSAPDLAAGRVKASPLARRLARERGLDLRRVEGSGPEGRIVAEDVERAATAPAWEARPAPQPAAGEAVPLSSLRRTIARRLTEAWQAPHFAIAMSADARRLGSLREMLVARAPEGAVRPTLSDVVTKLCALALLSHPALNAHYEGEEIREFPYANVGFAVAIPGGLVVPVIRGCERLAIPELAAARHELVERARAGRLAPEDLEGGTFTISNLGMYGVERFTAVLNPPQVAILAVGAVEERAVVEAGSLVARPRLDLTLSCDHRAVDGATASEFLSDLKALLEEPGLAL